MSEPQFAFMQSDGRYGLGWIERPDIRFALGLDGLSLWLFVLTSILMITSIAASWASIHEKPAAYYAFLLALQTGLLGLFASLDVVLFYIFFEFTLIPLFFLIGLWGGPQRRRAAVTFFLYTLAGSLLTLLGVISLVVVHYQHSAGQRADVFDSRADERAGDPELERVEERRLLEQPAGADLPAAAGRVRDQGSAVSVPHLAAAGSRRGADGRVDLAGRRVAQGGELRADPVQYRHDARWRRPRCFRSWRRCR